MIDGDRENVCPNGEAPRNFMITGQDLRDECLDQKESARLSDVGEIHASMMGILHEQTPSRTSGAGSSSRSPIIRPSSINRDLHARNPKNGAAYPQQPVNHPEECQEVNTYHDVKQLQVVARDSRRQGDFAQHDSQYRHEMEQRRWPDVSPGSMHQE